MYVYMYICMYVYLSIYLSIYIYTYRHTYIQAETMQDLADAAEGMAGKLRESTTEVARALDGVAGVVGAAARWAGERVMDGLSLLGS